MTTQLWAVLGLLITNAVFMFGMWKWFDARIGRVYERMDETKKYSDEKFVHRDLCTVMHNSTSNNLTGLEARVEKRIDKLEETFKKMFEEIMTLLKR